MIIPLKKTADVFYGSQLPRGDSHMQISMRYFKRVSFRKSVIKQEALHRVEEVSEFVSLITCKSLSRDHISIWKKKTHIPPPGSSGLGKNHRWKINLVGKNLRMTPLDSRDGSEKKKNTRSTRKSEDLSGILIWLQVRTVFRPEVKMI